jgi:hypothetical protein
MFTPRSFFSFIHFVPLALFCHTSKPIEELITAQTSFVKYTIPVYDRHSWNVTTMSLKGWAYDRLLGRFGFRLDAFIRLKDCC